MSDVSLETLYFQISPPLQVSITLIHQLQTFSNFLRTFLKLSIEMCHQCKQVYSISQMKLLEEMDQTKQE